MEMHASTAGGFLFMDLTINCSSVLRNIGFEKLIKNRINLKIGGSP
jgi:hypothetical protein